MIYIYSVIQLNFLYCMHLREEGLLINYFEGFFNTKYPILQASLSMFGKSIFLWETTECETFVYYSIKYVDVRFCEFRRKVYVPPNHRDNYKNGFKTFKYNAITVNIHMRCVVHLLFNICMYTVQVCYTFYENQHHNMIHLRYLNGMIIINPLKCVMQQGLS